jgi:NADH:ubiquinone oxidoreductase subunit 6 (subunit J)
MAAMVSPEPAVPVPSDDPIVVRRARIARWVGLAKRVGYALLLLAVVAFVVAAIAGFPSGLVTVTLIALIAACVVLPVPIVMGYGLRAAEREDREAQARRAGGGPPVTRQ